jgi:predicted hotdog family 3-hydroxylacyl-ACP dehydratase
MYCLHHQGDKSRLAGNVEILLGVLRLLVTANAVPSSTILVAVRMEVIRSTETSVLTRATRRNILEYGVLRVLEYVHVEIMSIINGN